MTKRFLILALLLALLLPGSSFAASPGINWLGQVTAAVDNLTTTKGDILMDLGVTELNFVALIGLVAMVVRWNLAHMVIGSRPVNFTIGDLFIFFFQLFACCLMLHYYFSPLPGTELSLHNLFAGVAQSIAADLDQAIMDDFLTRCGTYGLDDAAGGMDIVGIIIYFIVIVLMALMDLAMFAIDAFGWVCYGIFSLFGPLAIPLYMTKHFSSKFWGGLTG